MNKQNKQKLGYIEVYIKKKKIKKKNKKIKYKKTTTKTPQKNTKQQQHTNNISFRIRI